MIARRILRSVAGSRPVLEGINLLSARRPRVLLYHRFGPQTTIRHLSVDVFEAQMKLLRERFNLMNVSTLCEALADRCLPRDTAVVTIDDGYEDVYHYAFPILKHYKIPATLYVTTGFLDRCLWLWPDAIAYILDNTTRQEVHWELGGVLPLRSAEERHEAWRVLATHGEELSTAELQAWLPRLAEDLGLALPGAPVDDYRAMSWDQLREIAAAGIEVGDHSWSHPVLTRCDESDVRWQVEQSKQRLEEAVGRPVRSFAYPHGASSPAVRAAVRAAGYHSAVGVETPSQEGDVYEVARMGSGVTLGQFQQAVFGVRILARQLGISI